LEITFLGTGTSVGVPVIGCGCEVCRSKDKRNQRTRCSVHIQTRDKKFVIDTPPEFRLQMIREGFCELDFLLFTHDHSDHLMGLDDVRPITRDKSEPMACYGPPETIKEIRQRFHYIFDKTDTDSWKPKIQLVGIEEKKNIEGLTITPLPVEHGKSMVYGYRIGDFAYISDVSEIPAKTMQKLQGLEILVLEALRFKPHYKHFNLDTAVKTAHKLKAKKTFFTHCTHDIDYKKVSKELPENIFLTYDGLKLHLSEED